LDLTEQLGAVETWHSHVRHDHVERLLVDLGEGGLAAGSEHHGPALAVAEQQVLQSVQDSWLIIHEQDPLLVVLIVLVGGGHAPESADRGRALRDLASRMLGTGERKPRGCWRLAYEMGARVDPEGGRSSQVQKEQTMRELILKMSMSIDGFVAGPEGRIDWI